MIYTITVALANGQQFPQKSDKIIAQPISSASVRIRLVG
jgi:hypothetical protein